MIENKKTVFYARVSSDTQSLEMQQEAAKPYLKDLLPDQLVTLTDDGVSALKNKIEKRPKLQELLNLIRNDEVDTLIVYQRDRLARDFYEYLEIIILIYTHKVKVIFTASGQLPFNHDPESGIHSEGFFGMLCQMEGMNITNRTKDAFEKAPHRIFGYIVNKSDNKRTYSINPEFQKTIHQLYEDCLSIKESKGLLELLSKYKTLIKRKESDVFNILTRPFYSGHALVNNSYVTLDYVPPFISLDLFVKVQEKLQLLVPGFNIDQLKKEETPAIIPTCFICKKPLTPSNSLEDNHFKCKTHKKVFIHHETLNQLIKDVLIDAITNTDTVGLEKKVLDSCSRLKAKITDQKEVISKEFKEKQSKLLTDVNFAKEKDKVKAHLFSLNSLQDEFHSLVTLENKINNHITKVKQLSDVLVSNLQHVALNEYRELFITAFIKEIEVHEKYVNFEIYMADFYDKNTG